MLYTVGMETLEAKRETPQPKRYPFRFSPVMIVLFVIGLVLCAAGFGLTLWRFLAFLEEDPGSVYGWMQHIILFFVCIFLAVLIIAMLIRSQYVITDRLLITRFGLIRSKYEIKSICSVHLFKGLDKLAVYFDDFQTKYIVIVVKPVWYEDFVRTLIDRKPSIGFSFSTPEEEEEIKRKK